MGLKEGNGSASRTNILIGNSGQMYKNQKRDLPHNQTTMPKSQRHITSKNRGTLTYEITTNPTLRSITSISNQSTESTTQGSGGKELTYTSIPGYEFCLEKSQLNTVQHCMPANKPQGCSEGAWENLKVQFVGNTCPNGQRKRRKRNSRNPELCENTWHQCPTILDASLFYGKVVMLSNNTGYTIANQLANINTIGEFSCDDGWMLHPSIKEISAASSMLEVHKIVCMKHGWFVLKPDGKTAGPKLLPCQQKRKCKVLKIHYKIL